MPRAKPKPAICTRCQSEYLALGPRSKYCSPCRLIVRDENNARYRAENPEYFAKRKKSPEYMEYARRYSENDRKKNPDKVKESYRRWEEKNPDHAKAWLDKNREKARQQVRRRRAARYNAGQFSVSEKDLLKCLNRLRWECAYCNCDLRAVKIHWDHVMPIAAGGKHSIGNLLPTCAACNLSKNSSFLYVWKLCKATGRPMPRNFFKHHAGTLD